MEIGTRILLAILVCQTPRRRLGVPTKGSACDDLSGLRSHGGPARERTLQPVSLDTDPSRRSLSECIFTCPQNSNFLIGLSYMTLSRTPCRVDAGENGPVRMTPDDRRR